MYEQQVRRRLSTGAEVQSSGSVHFRVWAPLRQSVAVVVLQKPDKEIALVSEGNGFFSALTGRASAGSRYSYRLDGEEKTYPDPTSRFQPEGPHWPSQVIDPNGFQWTDEKWNGCGVRGQIIYEMHIGTFTREGTWAAAMAQLPSLADLGVTVLEIMPVADFAGDFGWGYDGVNLFAPTRLYGSPDDFRRFVDKAHSLDLGVILDVVYNHIGPDGNYLKQFSSHYFTDRYKNDWGEAINFDGDDNGPVREFFAGNASYWIDEFHLDGLRLDATQQIYDSSKEHILAVIGRRVREKARGRDTILVAENEPQHVKLVRPVEQGGYGLDMLWNDDYHHSAMTVLSGHNEAYYTDYHGTPQEFISAAKWGYLYQGQRYKWQKQRRGTPSFGLPPTAFVNFLQNHDQIANSGAGLRCHQLSSPGRFRALTAYTLLMPGTPMLFQGDEFASSSPFLFFADHHPELAVLVKKGRAEFLAQFPSLALPEMQARLTDPADPKTFSRCILDFSERTRNAGTYALHRDLIQLRLRDPVLFAPDRGQFDGAVLGPEAFLLRYYGGAEGDRLLVVNLGRDLHLDPIAEPLLASPEDCRWTIRWSSEDPRYGGLGTPEPDTSENWRLPGHATLLLVPRPILSDPKA
ncbi:MAG: malto-oligosyltrehalose trehalohydrolase [Planctomycetes bacterium]|nr:malto-oligosyltrehalose trehalohydrolase [Planctomycetota bacterium]